jgi:dienelactone hydrolase
MAERMIPSHDPRKVQTYRLGLAAFKKGMQLRREPVEWVEVPYQGKAMPALFSKAPVPGRAPCMVHFDGFDGLKESSYRGAAEEFRRRGISLLVVDHPGVGEALRLRNMASGPDTEVPAGACVDYLETRPEVDAQRIGIMALSLGGYYAPRAAALEKRFKCCVAWGAVWDWGELVSRRLAGRGGERSVPDWADQLTWVLGKKTVEEAVAFAQQFTLKDISEKITCPLLVIHGENDRQIPVANAEKTIAAAVNSPQRKLKIFTLAEGGAEHCQVDNSTMAVDHIADWVAKILGGDPQGLSPR